MKIKDDVDGKSAEKGREHEEDRCDRKSKKVKRKYVMAGENGRKKAKKGIQRHFRL